MTTSQSLSVIVPLYNEEKALTSAFAEVLSFLDRSVPDFEVLMVESGSTDRTGSICDELSAHDRRVKVIHEGTRNGFGSAVKVGFGAATKDLVMILTTDVPYPLDAILKGMALIVGHDCVLSYRSQDRRGLFRRVQSFCYNVLVKSALKLPFRSVNSAFKLFRRRDIQGMTLRSSGWLIDAEILAMVKQRYLSYVEMPVPLKIREMGGSSVGPLAFIGVLRELKSLLASRRRAR